ncbi:hypothetical protein MTR_3g465500 [Medicago truncatula]|uniref:Uncharacterized protein n=1 Tax=Medicago truncatula TaxID=3880 RepID=A0A072V8A3_MEDTR|nr:hypothetical protein MTR_3g465500 [Medicago truncatula]
MSLSCSNFQSMLFSPSQAFWYRLGIWKCAPLQDLRLNSLWYQFQGAKRKVRHQRETEASQLGWHTTETPILYRLSNT